ncbi:MAG: hypothetical protein GDA67_00595 [Nitrospira sp. CR1.3]|nr:hypothetical protein [Nitrospira sp. CR1.3]
MQTPACRPLAFLLTGFTWLLLASLLGLAILVGMVRGTPLPSWLRLVHVHGALVGGVAQMIMGAMLAFIPPLLMTGQNRPDSRPILFVAVNGGALGMLLGFGFRNFPLVAAGGFVVLTAFLSVASDAWRQARHSLNAPPLNLWFYGLALLALSGGLALGLGMATQFVEPSWYGRARLVHLHLNLLGFVTLAIVGTMHNLLPTILQKSLYSPRLARIVLFMLPAGIVILIIGFSASSLKTELIAGGLLMVGVGLYAFNLFSTWRNSDHAGNAASDHLLIATFFLVLAVLMGVLVAANYLWDPPVLPFGTLHLVAYTHMALVGFVLQTIFGALSHLVPITLAVSRVPSHKKRGPYLEKLTAIVDRWRTVQVGGLSLGTMGLALIATLTWTMPLGSNAVHAATWGTFVLFIIALALFAAKLAWALGTPTPE